MIDNVITIGISLLATAIIATLLGLVYSNSMRARRLARSLIQAEIDKKILLDKIDELKDHINTIEISKTDDFVGFLSQSRDWAFEYIEDVQNSIRYLQNAKNDSNVEEIDLAYNHLLGFLPNEENK